MTMPMVDAADAVEVLNRALEKDPDAVRALFKHRADCNDALRTDEAIQVGGEPPSVGLLGLLNGIFGVRPEDKYGHISAAYDDSGVLVRFELTSSWKDH